MQIYTSMPTRLQQRLINIYVTSLSFIVVDTLFLVFTTAIIPMCTSSYLSPRTGSVILFIQRTHSVIINIFYVSHCSRHLQLVVPVCFRLFFMTRVMYYLYHISMTVYYMYIVVGLFVSLMLPQEGLRLTKRD